MKNDTFLKATQLKDEINELKEKIYYLKEPCNCAYNKSEKEELQKQNRFHFGGLFKDKKLNINVAPRGWSGGKSIEVDYEFLEHCAKYFEKKLNEKIEEFGNL